MNTTSDSYRLDRIEARHEETQRELRRRLNRVEACLQQFDDHLTATKRTVVRGSLWSLGIAVVFFSLGFACRLRRR